MNHTILPTKTGIDLRKKKQRYAVIGDVHGCFNTLQSLLLELGSNDGYNPPADLQLISVGDLNDKGPYTVETLKWAMELTKAGSLHTVDSNHGRRLARRLVGECKPGGSVESSFSMIQKENKSGEFSKEVVDFLSGLPAYLRVSDLDGKEVVVAHAAAAERLLGAITLTERERNFFLGADSFKWTGDHRVVTGHVTVEEPLSIKNSFTHGHSIRIDTGVNKGNKLTAFLPDEDRFISIATDKRDLV
jgi:protein phosphatase